MALGYSSNRVEGAEACKHTFGHHGSHRFPTTSWSLVAGAHVGTPEGRDAFGALIGPYWYPLYAFVRRSGYSPSDAEELTQAFFAALFERDDIGKAASRLEAESVASVDGVREPRFRRWLLRSLRNFLANHRKYLEAEKRGGKVKCVTMDYQDAERRYREEPTTTETPEALYVRQWALALVRQAHETLRWKCTRAGKGPRFEVLKAALAEGMSDADCERLAPALSVTPVALKAEAFRLRREFRELLRGLIRATLNAPLPSTTSTTASLTTTAESLVDDELRVLLGSLG